jgi:osmotically-inducible protein OsmY
MRAVGTLCAVALEALVVVPARADEAESRESTAKQDEIQTKLENDPGLANNRVDVRVSSDGVATLTGVVDSDGERSKAAQLASVPGVRLVDDQLKVGAAGIKAADSAITTSIERQLFSKADLRTANVTVTTTNGVVSLTGAVPSPAVRQTAVDLARRTEGVIRVDDHLRLVGNTPSDPEVPLR